MNILDMNRYHLKKLIEQSKFFQSATARRKRLYKGRNRRPAKPQSRDRPARKKWPARSDNRKPKFCLCGFFARVVPGKKPGKWIKQGAGAAYKKSIWGGPKSARERREPPGISLETAVPGFCVVKL